MIASSSPEHYGESGIAQRKNSAAVIAVCGVARNQKQQDTGKKLCQTNQSEIEGSLRDLVYLPADRDRLHLGSQHDAESRHLVKRECGVRKRNGAGEPGTPGSGHCILLCHRIRIRTRTGRASAFLSDELQRCSTAWAHTSAAGEIKASFAFRGWHRKKRRGDSEYPCR